MPPMDTLTLAWVAFSCAASLDGRSKDDALQLLDTLDDEVTFVVRHDDAMRDYLETQRAARASGRRKAAGATAASKEPPGSSSSSRSNGEAAGAGAEVKLRPKKQRVGGGEGKTEDDAHLRPKTVDFSLGGPFTGTGSGSDGGSAGSSPARHRAVRELSVLLLKPKGAHLGFGVAGGVDPQGNSKPITIRRVSALDAAQGDVAAQWCESPRTRHTDPSLLLLCLLPPLSCSLADCARQCC